MVITEEIIAAYIEGNVTTEEKTQVRMYLAKHPEMQDLVLALMDDDVISDNDIQKDNTVSLNTEESFTDIAYAAAAFAPKMSIVASNHENPKDKIAGRRERMESLWNELEID